MIAALLVLAAVPGQSECRPVEAPKTSALSREAWSADTRSALEALLRSRGATSRSFDPCARPLAVLDLDGTIVLRDLGARALELALRDRRLDREIVKSLDESKDHAATIDAAFEGPSPATATALFEAVGGGASRAALRGWLAKALAGLDPEARVTIRAEVQGDARLRPELLELVRTLVEHGFDVFAISESPEWLLGGLGARLGIPDAHLLGVRVAVGKDGRLTTTLVPPVPVGAGKLGLARSRIAPGGRGVALAVGDSASDLALFEAAELAVFLGVEGSADERAAVARGARLR